MKYTNNKNLPAPIVKVVTKDDYDSGDCDISVTTLIGSARQSQLTKVHKDDLVEDASDCIYRALGSILHKILEEVDTEVTERRLSMKVEGLAGKIWTISGALDRYKVDGGILQDYKLTSAWKFNKTEPDPAFSAQLNIYAEILRYNKIEVNSAEIHGILRDWSKMQVMRDKNYPRCQYHIQQIPLWPREQVQAYLKERVIAHQLAEETLPECTDEDRWAKPPKYAVMKKGRKTALKLYDTQEAASTHAAREGKLCYVEFRPSVANRCEHYCSVNGFCEQYQKTLKGETDE